MNRMHWGIPATALVLALLAALAWQIGDFLIANAVWTGPETACHAAAGACWPFVAAHAGSFVFGYDPAHERWRLDLLLALPCAAALLLVFIPSAASRRKGVLALCAALLPPLAAALVLLAPSPTLSQLGGLCLTLALSIAALWIGLPIGLGLALMRESDMPVLRTISALWIELWRGLPTIVVLFFAIAAFPLLAPPGTEIQKVIRALAAFTLLTSALFAEAIRAGLRAVPPAQVEAAQALNLHPVITLRRIVLPQALRVAAPSIVNVSVALIKETTLILVVGLYDLFGMVQNFATDPRIASESVTSTGYAVAAAGYFVLCFGLSYVAKRLER